MNDKNKIDHEVTKSNFYNKVTELKVNKLLLKMLQK